MNKIIHDLSELPKEAEVLSLIATYHKGTFLPRIKNTFMFVQTCEEMPLVIFMQDPEDAERYSWLRTDPHTYIWIPNDGTVFKHLPQVRKYMQKKVVEANIQYVVLMDDDLRFTRRPSVKTEPTRYEPLNDSFCPKLSHKSTAKRSRHVYIEMIRAMGRALDAKHPVVSVIQRFGSNSKVKTVIDGRALHIWLMDMKVLAEHDVFFDDSTWSTTDDFRFLFDLAKAGLHDKILVDWVHDDYVSRKSQGGCNEYRNGKEHIYRHNESCKLLASDFPEFCRAVWEQNSPYNEEGAFNPKVDWKALNRYATAHEK